MRVAQYNVHGSLKSRDDLSYEDLLWLFEEYKRLHNGDFPQQSDQTLNNNLPHNRIITSVLRRTRHNYGEFWSSLGKTAHVRAEIGSYAKYVSKIQELSEELGRPVYTAELFNNQYGLPSAPWLIKNCPDSNVKTWEDFLRWANIAEHSHTWTKQETDRILREYATQHKKVIRISDVNAGAFPFSSIVINRIYGGISAANKELGIEAKYSNKAQIQIDGSSKIISVDFNIRRPLDYYQRKLRCVLESIRESTGRTIIGWADIENPAFNDEHPTEHKTYTSAFKIRGQDVFEYIRSMGFVMKPHSAGTCFNFDDGERTKSRLEYIVSSHLRECGFVYNETYFRDVMYKHSFPDLPSSDKTNCDYVIALGDTKLYIEVLGMLGAGTNTDNWMTSNPKNKRTIQYLNKSLLKHDILTRNHAIFLFLFADEINDGGFKSRLDGFILDAKTTV